jgi:hypothetical protein
MYGDKKRKKAIAPFAFFSYLFIVCTYLFESCEGGRAGWSFFRAVKLYG